MRVCKKRKKKRDLKKRRKKKSGMRNNFCTNVHFKSQIYDK